MTYFSRNLLSQRAKRNPEYPDTRFYTDPIRDIHFNAPNLLWQTIHLVELRPAANTCNPCVLNAKHRSYPIPPLLQLVIRTV